MDAQEISHRRHDDSRFTFNEDVATRGASIGPVGYRLPHRALVCPALARVAMSLTLFRKRLEAPLLISSMTGGVPAGLRGARASGFTIGTCMDSRW